MVVDLPGAEEFGGGPEEPNVGKGTDSVRGALRSSILGTTSPMNGQDLPPDRLRQLRSY